MSGSEEVLKFIKEVKCKKLLVDNTNIFGPWQSVNAWYQSNWNPRAAAEGLTHIAFVMSKDLFSQISVQGYSKISRAVFDVAVFDSEKEARDWLDRNN